MEKCKACKEADDLRVAMGVCTLSGSANISDVNVLINHHNAYHLEKYHCECKKTLSCTCKDGVFKAEGKHE